MEEGGGIRKRQVGGASCNAAVTNANQISEWQWITPRSRIQ